MSEETFSTLNPQVGDPPEVLRMKLGVAAARLAALTQDHVAVDLAALRGTVDSLLPLLQQLVPLPVPARCLEFLCTGEAQPLATTPTYFRKALFWGANLAGTNNALVLRLLHGTNGNRLITSGQMVEIEAPAGQVLDLQAFQLSGGYIGDALAVELY